MNDVLLLKFPTLRQWATAVLSRPSVAQTFHLDEVVALRQRAVPTWRGSSLPPPPPLAARAPADQEGRHGLHAKGPRPLLR
jgi:hypothetical protein